MCVCRERGRKNTNINVNKTCVATVFCIKIQLTDDEVFSVSPSRENKYDSLKSPKVFSHIHVILIRTNMLGEYKSTSINFTAVFIFL